MFDEFTPGSKLNLLITFMWFWIVLDLQFRIRARLAAKQKLSNSTSDI